MGEKPIEGEKKEKIIVYQLNDEIAAFEELDLDENVKLYELLDPSFILLFLDPEHYKAYIWQGSEVSIRMKFLSANLAASVRDKHGPAMKIVTQDEGNEDLGFKIMVGLEKPVEYKEEQTGPAYKGTEEDIELLNLVSMEKIILILEKIGCPEGLKREMVIVGKKIYKYSTQDKEYMGSMIEEKKLYELKEQVPDGPYLAEGYIPRMLFSFNNIVLVELFRRMTSEEIAKEAERVKAREEFNKKRLEALQQPSVQTQ